MTVVGQADPQAGAISQLARIDDLVAAIRAGAEGLDAQLVQARHAAFAELDRSPRGGSWWPADPARAVDDDGCLPELAASEVSAEALRAGIEARGTVILRGVLPGDTVAEMTAGIDRALEEWAALKRPYLRPTGSPWFDGLPLDEESKAKLGRTWVTNAAGLLIADSPRMLHLLLEALERAGLREVVTDYLGERPALSANKCTLRRVPVDSDAQWHQDGAFLGSGIRAINLWIALTDCGVDAPGLDIVPRRFDGIVPTGTHGSWFDWAVGDGLVDELTTEEPVVRPQFRAGDICVFDDLMLHRTATSPSMTKVRHAIETWMFAPSAYPVGHVPIVW